MYVKHPTEMQPLQFLVCKQRESEQRCLVAFVKQKLLSRAVLPTLMTLLDQPDTVDMVLPSVLAVIGLLSPEDYNSLVRSEMKKLLNNASSVQVTASLYRSHPQHWQSGYCLWWCPCVCVCPSAHAKVEH